MRQATARSGDDPVYWRTLNTFGVIFWDWNHIDMIEQFCETNILDTRLGVETGSEFNSLTLGGLR